MVNRQSSAGRLPSSRRASRGLAFGVLALGLGACNLLPGGVPRVSGVSPADGATNVPVNSDVVASLTLPGGAQLDVTTLTDAAVTLTDSSGAAVAGLRTPQGSTLVFNPDADLELDASYTFTVTTDVKTTTGASLQAFSSSFSTGDAPPVEGSGLVADRTPVVFTAGGSSSSDARTLTLTNSGTETVDITGLSVGGADAAQFRLADSAPSSLAPGAARTLNLTFTPDGLGPQFATLTVSSSGAPLAIPLGGLGVAGQGGANEPSLQYILDTYGLGIETGDENPSTIGITGTDSNGPVGPTEVAGEFYRKADPAQPVTVQVLAAFGVDNTPVTRFGYKAAGDGGAETAVLSLSGEPGLNEQRLNPVVTPASGTAGTDGTVTFDPGAVEFGLFSFWPGNRFFGERTVYSESALNTFTNALPLHVRTYPLPGEANAYVVATEEFNLAGGSGAENDYNDIVVVIRNVIPGGEFPVPPAPEPPVLPPANGIAGLTVRTTTGLPYPDRLVLQKIENLAPRTCDGTNPTCVPAGATWSSAVFPTTGTVTLQNTGAAPLQLSLSIRNDNLFVINGPSTLSLQPGASTTVPLEFSPQDVQVKGVYPAGLVVQSGVQSAGLELRGLYLRRPEGSAEVYLAPMVNDLFGYDIDLGANSGGGITSPEADSSLAGEEVRSDYWQAANPATPVTVVQLAAFQTCCTIGERFRTFALIPRGSSSPLASMVYQAVSSQSVFPVPQNGDVGELTQLSTTTSSAFEVRSGNLSSNPDLGSGNGRLGVRFWPLKDRSGNAVPNAYLIGQDFVAQGCGGSSTPSDNDSDRLFPAQDPEPVPEPAPEQPTAPASNCDYNDNIYLITNVQPAN